MASEPRSGRRDVEARLELRRRDISEDDLRRFEGYLAEILAALGLDLDAPATRDTPRRFVRALLDATAGYEGDPGLLSVLEAEGQGEPASRLSQLIEGPIPFHALCEHHALPFFGRAYVGYVPAERLIGLSRLGRIVRLFARRFTLQERLGRQVADALEALLEPHGVAVYLEARHLCTQMRDLAEPAQTTRTALWRGEYEANPALRAEFLAACRLEP